MSTDVIEKLELTEHPESYSFAEPQFEIQALQAMASGDLNTVTHAQGWKVTRKRGRIVGVGASSSGLGGYAYLEGYMDFKMKRLESSKTYKEMVRKYSIGGGIRGFWSWLGIGAHASTHKTEIQRSLKEMCQSEAVGGRVNVKVEACGMIPNVQVDASAYLLILQITDDQGNTTNVFASSGGSGDVGAQDQDGNNLPTKDNESTIEIGS